MRAVAQIQRLGTKSKPKINVEELLAEEDEDVTSPQTARQRLEELLADESDEELRGYEVVDKEECPPAKGQQARQTAKKIVAGASALARRVNSLRAAASQAGPYYGEPEDDFSDESDEPKKKKKKKPKKPPPPPPAPEPQPEHLEKIQTLQKKLELLKAHAGLNDDEIDWKLAETATDDPYGLAVARRESCEAEYDRLMWHQSKLETLVRICEDRRVMDALAQLAKVARDEGVVETTTTAAAAAATKPPDTLFGAAKETEQKDVAATLKRIDRGRALGAALGARGRGGGLMAAIAARGGGGRGGGGGICVKKKPPKTVASCRQALEQARTKSQQDVKRLPVALREFGIVERTLARVCESSSQKDLAAACDAAKETLEAAVATYKTELADVSKQILETEDDLDRWRKREADAPNKSAALAKQEEEWAARERAENALALAITRTLVPPDVARESAESLRTRAAKRVAVALDEKRDNAQKQQQQQPLDDKQEAKRAFLLAAKWGGLYTFELAQRIKTCKPLHWVQAHPDDLLTANFLAGAGAETFKNLADYDLVELRAIYACCPAKFELDASGAKAAWRAALVDRLRELTARDRGETVAAGWDGEKNERKVVRLPALAPKHKRHSSYYYPSSHELEARSKKYEEARRRLEDRRGKVADLEAKVADAKLERDAAFVDARSEYLQHRYGKQMLKDLAKEADDHFKRLSADLGSDTSAAGARADLKRARAAVSNANPSEAEHAYLRKLLDKYGLDRPDPDADARDLKALRDRVLQKLSLSSSSSATEEERWAFEGRGRLIRGPFDPWPEIKKEKVAVVKKLSDAEEAELRKKELRQSTAAATTTEAQSKRKIHDAWRQERSASFASSSETSGAKPVSSKKHALSSAKKTLEPVAPKSRRLSQLLAQEHPTDLAALQAATTTTTKPTQTAAEPPSSEPRTPA